MTLLAQSHAPGCPGAEEFLKTILVDDSRISFIPPCRNNKETVGLYRTVCDAVPWSVLTDGNEPIRQRRRFAEAKGQGPQAAWIGHRCQYCGVRCLWCFHYSAVIHCLSSGLRICSRMRSACSFPREGWFDTSSHTCKASDTGKPFW